MEVLKGFCNSASGFLVVSVVMLLVMLLHVVFNVAKEWVQQAQCGSSLCKGAFKLQFYWRIDSLRSLWLMTAFYWRGEWRPVAHMTLSYDARISNRLSFIVIEVEIIQFGHLHGGYESSFGFWFNPAWPVCKMVIWQYLVCFFHDFFFILWINQRRVWKLKIWRQNQDVFQKVKGM